MMQDTEAIYREHAQMVFKFLMSKTLDADLSEELTQETFYQAIRSIDRYDGSCKITTWLCQIAKHVWLQHLEKQKKHAHEELPPEMLSPLNVEQQILSAESRLELYKLLHELEEPMREVMYLRITGELSFRQIGEILGRDETWARVTFYRGKQKIMKGVNR